MHRVVQDLREEAHGENGRGEWELCGGGVGGRAAQGVAGSDGVGGGRSMKIYHVRGRVRDIDNGGQEWDDVREG